MTVTIPAQSDELRVVESPPTATDAQLILQIQQTSAIDGANEGWMLLDNFDAPPTLSQLRRRYPKDSPEYLQVHSFLASCETIGTLVKHGVLHAGLVRDMWWIGGAWARAEKICKGMRKESGEPRLFENFEALARTAA